MDGAGIGFASLFDLTLAFFARGSIQELFIRRTAGTTYGQLNEPVNVGGFS